MQAVVSAMMADDNMEEIDNKVHRSSDEVDLPAQPLPSSSSKFAEPDDEDMEMPPLPPLKKRKQRGLIIDLTSEDEDPKEHTPTQNEEHKDVDWREQLVKESMLNERLADDICHLYMQCNSEFLPRSSFLDQVVAMVANVKP